MSTLIEIEAAVDALPSTEQLTLLRHLESRLWSSDRARVVEENGMPVLVAPPDAPPMTTEWVKAALADFP